MSVPMSDAAAKHPNPTAHPVSKLKTRMHHLTSDMHRLGVAVRTTLNPNHRHDEAWEKEVDAKIEKIRDGHRFRSFAGERDGNIVKWHVDGHGEYPVDRTRRQASVSTWLMCRLLLGFIRDYRFGERGVAALYLM